VNLSEKDYIRQKNKHLAKIKNWIDTNNPGDLLIPFSVALEDRLSKMSEEESAEELKKLGTKSALPRIAVSGMDPQNSLSLSFSLVPSLPSRLSLPFPRLLFVFTGHCFRGLVFVDYRRGFEGLAGVQCLLFSVCLFLDYLEIKF